MNTTPRAYIDFNLYLTSSTDKKSMHRVSLLPTPEAGETIVPVSVPLSEIPPESTLQLLAAKQITFGGLVSLGKKLANCLLPEGIIRERLKTLYDQAGIDGGIRIRLIIADYALKAWPWEYVYIDFIGGADSKSMLGFIVLNPRISMIRHEPLPHPHPLLEKTTKDVTDIRMAFASALPVHQPLLRLDKDIAVIRKALKDFNVEGVHLTLDPVLKNATPEDIVNKLPKGTHIFHFAGHGIPESGSATAGPHRESAILLLANKKSKTEARLHASDLAAIVLNAGVRLVVLGACYSGERRERTPWEGLASALAAREIPAIVAMQYAVYDVSAIVFNRAFYGALASGLSLDESMSAGRRAMLRETSTNPDLTHEVDVEWGVPVLYSRLPDGQLFPERMQRAGQVASQFRKVIRMIVDELDKGGSAIGVSAEVIKRGFMIDMEIENVPEGSEATAVKTKKIEDEAQLNVTMKIGKVKGKATALKVKEI